MVRFFFITIFILSSIAHAENFFELKTIDCKSYDCYAFGSIGGGVGEGIVDHPISGLYPEGEKPGVKKEYPPLLNFLPIGRKKAMEEGIYLPLPIGTALNFVFLNQGMDISNVRFSQSTDIDNLIFDDPRDIRFGPTVRGGLWLFPFLNIYFLGGYQWGKTELKGTATSTSLGESNFNIDVDYHGGQIGAGSTLAYGYKNFFAIIDGNYSWSFINIADDTVKSWTISPKIGMMFESSNKISSGSVYVGAMFLDFALTFNGMIPDKNIPFKVDGGPKENWNFIFGSAWEFNPRWSVVAEAGVGERKQFVFGGMFRF